MKRSTFRTMRAARFSIVMAALASSAPIAAQPLKEPSDDSILITARKRSEALARAGVPVSVVGGQELLDQGITTAAGLNERLPALTIQPNATGNLIFIRGVGNFTLQPNSDPAIAFAYDGIFISRPMGTLSQLFDLDRVELLKGPQGVLYGRNASAGSINLEPRQPVIGERAISAAASFASYDDLRAETAVNLPVGPAAAFRLSGALSRQDNFLSGYRTGPSQASVRAQFKALVGENLTVRLSGDYNHIGGVGIGTHYVGNYVFVPAVGAYRFIDANLPGSEGIYAPASQAYRQTIFLGSAGRLLDAIGSRPWQNHQFYGAHVRIDADLGFGRLTLLPAWRHSSINAVVSGAPFGYRQREQDDQSSVEARLSGTRGRVDWLAGTLLFKDHIDSDVVTNLSSALMRSRQRYGTFSTALFANATIHFADRLRLNGGLRWTRDRKHYDSSTDSLAIVCQRRVNNQPSCPTVPLFPLVDDLAAVPFAIPATPGVLPISVGGVATGANVVRSRLVATGRLTDAAFTWRFGSEFDLSSRSLLYASIETGHRPGGFNTATGFETYGPERITAYTFGLRTRSADERLQLDLEAFWWNYRDQQVSSLRPDLSSPPRNANITEDIGNSRIRGVEADLRLKPFRRTQLRAIVQYLDAAYRSFRYVNANTGVPPLTGCAASLSAVTNVYTVDCTAQQPYNSPRWTMNLSARQGFAIGASVLTAAFDTQFRSARNIGFAFLPEQRIGPTWTSNAQLILDVTPQRLQLAAFVHNLEGHRVPQFMIYHPVSNALVASTSPPRQFGIRASLGF